MPDVSSPETAVINQEPTILRETDDWLVVNKPPLWHCIGQPTDADSPPTIQSWLATRRPELQNVGIESGLVHRLDQLTSGALLVAKNASTLQRLSDALRADKNQAVAKQYLALTDQPVWRDGGFELYFSSRYKRSKQVTVDRTGNESQRGRCRWQVIGPVEDGSLLLVDLIGPGRRHQIRAGLASVGYPLRGDLLYGGQPWENHLGLHAWRLTVDGHTITSDPPPFWSLPASLDLPGQPSP